MNGVKNFFAPISEVRAYNSRKGGSVPGFDFSSRGKHFTLNGKTSASTSSADESAKHCLMVGGGSNNSSSAPRQPSQASSDIFFVSLHGKSYPFSNKVGRIMYHGCGRTIRRAMHDPTLFFSKVIFTCCVFFASWYCMHFGGALATFNFPRTDQVSFLVCCCLLDWRVRVGLRMICPVRGRGFHTLTTQWRRTHLDLPFFLFYFLSSSLLFSPRRRPTTPSLCRT